MNKKMKRMGVFSLVLLLSLGLTSMSFADSAIEGFTLKLGGGAGTWNGSDVNDFFRDTNIMMNDEAGLISGGDVVGQIDELNFGPDFEAEFVLELPKNFAVGIGVGYMVRSSDSTAGISMFGVDNSVDVETRFTAIPITLNGYYNLPLGEKTKVYLKGGVGYYIGKAKYFVRQEQTILGLSPAWEEEDGNASSNAFGFHGGIGFQFDLTESVALFFETNGRIVNLKNWEGKNKYRDYLGASESQSVEWYYVEEYDGMTRKWYRDIKIFEDEPSGSNYRNVRMAEVSYSGVVLCLGVKITFGKK